MAIGLDRLLMLLANSASIDDVLNFPNTQGLSLFNIYCVIIYEF